MIGLQNRPFQPGCPDGKFRGFHIHCDLFRVALIQAAGGIAAVPRTEDPVLFQQSAIPLQPRGAAGCLDLLKHVAAAGLGGTVRRDAQIRVDRSPVPAGE